MTSAKTQKGFSLLELLIAVAILSIVMGVVMRGVTTLQARNVVENNKLDLTQESRQFMDQIVNDLRQSGFPRMPMFDPTAYGGSPGAPPDCRLNSNIACGLRGVSTNWVWFEGDVDGTGVSTVILQLVQTNGSTTACTAPPCVIQRGTISKQQFMAGALPTYYTELSGVMNTTVFTAYDNNGQDLGPQGSNVLPIADGAYQSGYNIRAIGVTLFVQSQQRDPQTGQFPTVTMVSTARVND